MLKKQINIVLIIDFDSRGFFGLGIHPKLFLTTFNVSLGNFCSLTQKFTFTLSSILHSILMTGQS
jgi:hypothetical protein